MKPLKSTKDWEVVARKPGRKGGRAIVSVPFPSEDFQAIAKEAERLGKPVSAYIREAATDRAKPKWYISTDSTTAVAGSLALYAYTG